MEIVESMHGRRPILLRKNENDSTFKLKMLSYRLLSFGQGVWDSLCLWKISSSKTLRSIVWKVLPLYFISTVVGAYFITLAKFVVPDEWIQQITLQTIWLLGWGTPIYVVGSLLQLRFAWVVTSIITSQQPAGLNENNSPASALIAEAFYGVALSITYLTQTYLYCLIAKVFLPAAISSGAATGINVAMIAWATSFAAFECKLIVKRCDLYQRIRFLETRWSYALGYGLTASLIYNFFPDVFATSVWQFMQLLLTLRAITISLPDSPPPSEEKVPRVCNWLGPRFRIFRLAQALATALIKTIT